MRTGENIWLRAGVLGALIVTGVVAALVLDLPDAATVRGWLDGEGAGGWAMLVGGLAVVLLGRMPRWVL